MKFQPGMKKPPGSGRKPGSKNKKKQEAEAFASELLDDPKYLESLKHRLIKGTAPHMETLLCHYKWGRPVDRKSVGFEDSDGNAINPTFTLILKHAASTPRKTDRGV